MTGLLLKCGHFARGLAWLAAWMLLPQVAVAHGLSPGIGDFYAGAYNLIAGPVDVLIWVSVAGLGALHAQRQAGWVSEAFAAGLLTGLIGARITGAGAMPELADAAALLVLGGVTAGGRRLPAGVLYALVAIMGAARGWHYGADTLARADMAALAGGLVLAGYSLVACTLAVALWFANGPGRWRRVTLRALGSWTSAIAIMLGGFAMRNL